MAEAASNVTVWGMAITLLVAAGGWIVSARGQKTDSATMLVDAALKLADRHAVDEHDCRQELAALTQRVDGVVVDLADCHDRHARAEAAMAAAGIPLPD